MPYILSPIITMSSPGMWNEGDAYSKEEIYSIENEQGPPVNYDLHTLKPHSLTHIETPAHTMRNGKRLQFFIENHQNFFYGPTVVIRLEGNRYKKVSEEISHWEISLEELMNALGGLSLTRPPEKLLITTDQYFINTQGYHDPKYVLTLSQEAADYLVGLDSFHLYGTSWKSSDFMPKSPSRPIHNTLFQKAIILENLDLKEIPQGKYFMSAFPILLKDSSESPVTPVLYREDEIHFIF